MSSSPATHFVHTFEPTGAARSPRPEGETITTPRFNEFREQWLSWDPKRPRRTESKLFKTPTREIITLSSGGGEEASPCPPKSIKKRPPTSTAPLRPSNSTLSNSSIPKGRLGVLPRNRAEALGEISILIDERLFTRHVSCLGELQASITTGSAKLFSENAIIWTRKTLQKDQLSTPFVILVFDAHEVIVDIRSGDRVAIRDFLYKWRQRIPLQHTKIYYLIIGGKTLAIKLAAEINKQFRRCVMEGGRLQLTPSKSQVSWIDLEQMLWIVGMEMGIRIQFIDKAELLCSHLVEFSRNVAWEHYAHRNEGANFCVVSSKKCGKTLTETWKRFLEEIGRVAPTTADAIVAKYPTMSLLLDKYLTLSTLEAALLLLDIQVGTKTIGPALSKRIYRTLTSSESGQLANL